MKLAVIVGGAKSAAIAAKARALGAAGIGITRLREH